MPLKAASILSLFIFFGIACTPQPPQNQNFKTEVEYLQSDQTAAMNLPFSDAVQVDNLLFVSGQVGNLPGQMELAEGGMEAEARQAIENMKTVLEANGSSLNQIVKVTVMLADISEWSAFNEVYMEYFTDNLPARSAIGANGLALGARLEIECIATVN